jgi:hypothetical protein
MPETNTYYAIIDEFSSRDRPGGVLRRVADANGQVDEAFSPDLTWEFSPLLYAAEHVSVVEPEAQAMLLDFDRTATHRSVVVDAREA